MFHGGYIMVVQLGLCVTSLSALAIACGNEAVRESERKRVSQSTK